MTRPLEDRVPLYDDVGHLIGTIMRPVTPGVLGPGSEKVYLARNGIRPDSPSEPPERHAA